MGTLNNLKLSRAADRAALSAHLTTLAETHGAALERWEHGRTIHLTFTLEGAKACIGIDGDARMGLPIISWVAPRGPGQCFSRAFEVTVGAFGHASLHHKATTCPEDLDDLSYYLGEGLALIASGDAVEFFIHPWAADTAWVAAGSPENKQEWVAHYCETGKDLRGTAAYILKRRELLGTGKALYSLLSETGRELRTFETTPDEARDLAVSRGLQPLSAAKALQLLREAA